MLEQSIDRLSAAIEQLNKHLAAQQTTTKAVGDASDPKPASSSGATKPSASTAPSDSGKSAEKDGLDYFTDVAPRFSLLVAKDRPAAVALMRKRKADAKKLEEVVLVDGKHDQDLMVAVLTEINEALGG